MIQYHLEGELSQLVENQAFEISSKLSILGFLLLYKSKGFNFESKSAHCENFFGSESYYDLFGRKSKELQKLKWDLWSRRHLKGVVTLNNNDNRKIW